MYFPCIQKLILLWQLLVTLTKLLNFVSSTDLAYKTVSYNINLQQWSFEDFYPQSWVKFVFCCYIWRQTEMWLFRKFLVLNSEWKWVSYCGYSNIHAQWIKSRIETLPNPLMLLFDPDRLSPQRRASGVLSVSLQSRDSVKEGGGANSRHI